MNRMREGMVAGLLRVALLVPFLHFGENLYLLFKTGDTPYTGILPKNQIKGNLVMEHLCNVDYSEVVINGQVMDTSG